MRSRDSSVFSCARAWACTLRTSSCSVSPVMTAPDGPQVRLILRAMLLVDGAGCRTLDAECAEKHVPGRAPRGALTGETDRSLVADADPPTWVVHTRDHPATHSTRRSAVTGLRVLPADRAATGPARRCTVHRGTPVHSRNNVRITDEISQ
jgi:hypothetical protein